ncbi:MAG: hypothetical protein WAN48_02395, partial [Actinomycetes bacterium]
MDDAQTPTEGRSPSGRSGERRWPMATAVLVAGILHEFLPSDFRFTSSWLAFLYPVFLTAFLAVLVVGDPGRIDRDRHWLRITTGMMIGLITIVNAVAALRLIAGILNNKFDSAGQLLTIGAIVWVTNVIAFALWYWDLDAGGAAARARRSAGFT